LPTNVSPEYKKAEAAFRKARDPSERLSHLKEMLRTIPKHKGTEHLQADIKTRIKELTTELAGPKRKTTRTGPVYTVRPEGAAQVALVGPPNAGKSSLHAVLTGSQAEVGVYPHTTHTVLPGMLPYEDIHFQLVDLPPISAEFMESWMPNALQLAHAALLVVDLTIPGCVENVVAILDRLNEKRVTLVPDWAGRLEQGYLGSTDVAGDESQPGEGADSREIEDLDDTFRVYLRTLLVANKNDLGFDPDEIEVLEELIGVRFPAITISVKTGRGLDRIGSLLFHGLGIVRIYTKIPGRPADTNRPFTVFRGDTVLDVARLIHKDVAGSLKFARVWGSAKFDGQQVGKDYQVCDGDILELHS
jgi:ribosome-interacting GTPase 1